MLKFSANLSMLFNEVDFLARFGKAAQAGFKGVEYLFPYDWKKEDLAAELQKNGLTQVLFNLPAGNWNAGERGIACLPGRVNEFREGVEKAIDYAKALGCSQLNCLVGMTPGDDAPEKVRATLIENIRFAAASLEKAGFRLLIEALNSQDMPGFHLVGTAQVLKLLAEVGSANVYLQYDVYHMQIMEGNLTKIMLDNLGRISHIQIADNPGRHEPERARSTTRTCSGPLKQPVTTAGSVVSTNRQAGPKTASAGLDRIADMNGRDDAIAVFQAALQAADPYTAVASQLDRIRSLYQEKGFRKLYALAFGKAAAPMMQAVTDKAGDLLTGGMIITKYGHAATVRLPALVEVCEAGHPLPDQQGVAATRKAVAMLQKADEAALVLCLISGGGSALFVAPCDGVTLEEKQKVTGLLLRAGADIVELNTVRKHLSLVKGGQLAAIAHPARVISLILSDVIGDPLDSIASGPTAPDASTFEGAVAVLNKYGLMDDIPETVRRVMLDGQKGLVSETLKKESPVWKAVENCIVGSNAKATAAAVASAQGLGYEDGSDRLRLTRGGKGCRAPFRRQGAGSAAGMP